MLLLRIKIDVVDPPPPGHENEIACLQTGPCIQTLMRFHLPLLCLRVKGKYCFDALWNVDTETYTGIITFYSNLIFQRLLGENQMRKPVERFI